VTLAQASPTATALRRLAIAAAIGMLVGGCGPSASPSSGPVSPVDGIIVAVDGTNISIVRGFSLRTVTGQTIAFTLGQLENPTQFPPGHLKEHEATSQPVRVYFVAQGPTLLVYRLEDVPAAGATPSPPTGPPAS
jgi:hypothetical protein